MGKEHLSFMQATKFDSGSKFIETWCYLCIENILYICVCIFILTNYSSHQR